MWLNIVGTTTVNLLHPYHHNLHNIAVGAERIVQKWLILIWKDTVRRCRNKLVFLAKYGITAGSTWAAKARV